MFRKTDHFDTARIQEHIAAIKFLADTLKLSTQKHHVNEHINVLLNAIDTFEKHRFSDFTFNKTKRAEQVLNTRKIYNELYKSLKKSNAGIIAKALKMELKEYSLSVSSLVKSVQADLTTSLRNRHEAELIQQEADLLNKDLDLLSQEAAAYSLADYLSTLQENTEDNVVSEDESDYDSEYEYIQFDDQPMSEEELSAKPFLQGSFTSDSEGSDVEYIPGSDDETISELNFDSDMDEQSNDAEEQPLLPPSPEMRSPEMYHSNRLSWLNKPWANDSDSDDDYSDEDEMDMRPTEHRFSS